jgi:hypothetical protein
VLKQKNIKYLRHNNENGDWTMGKMSDLAHQISLSDAFLFTEKEPLYSDPQTDKILKRNTAKYIEMCQPEILGVPI